MTPEDFLRCLAVLAGEGNEVQIFHEGETRTRAIQYVIPSDLQAGVLATVGTARVQAEVIHLAAIGAAQLSAPELARLVAANIAGIWAAPHALTP